MSDIQSLGLVALLLYLSECFVWVGKGSAAFVRVLGIWREACAISALSTQGGGLAFVSPLALPGDVMVCAYWPVSGDDGGWSEERFRERLGGFSSTIAMLRWVTVFQFSLIYLIAPVLIIALGDWLLLYIIAAVLAVALATAVLFYLAHKKLLHSEKWKRISGILKVVVCPPLGIRVADDIAMQYFSGCNPALVAGALCKQDGIEPFAKKLLLALDNPNASAGEWSDALEDSDRKGYLAEFRKLVKMRGLDVGALTARPERNGNSSSYCPRCHGQYTAGQGTCADCGTTLKEF